MSTSADIATLNTLQAAISIHFVRIISTLVAECQPRGNPMLVNTIKTGRLEYLYPISHYKNYVTRITERGGREIEDD